MCDKNPTTIFSIYKIDMDKFKEIFEITSEPCCEKVVDIILKSTVKLIKNKHSYVCVQQIEHNGFKGILYKTEHNPEWQSLVHQFIEDDKSITTTEDKFEGSITNVNVSYILLYHHSDMIFAMTGGYGSTYVRKLAESNFGLYLLPKILQKDNQVVRNVIESNVSGNLLSAHRTNRSATSITVEQNLTSIYRQLNVEINQSIAKNLGIDFDHHEAKDKKVNLVNKDSIVIRRSLSLDEVKKIIEKISEINSKPNNFALSYLIEARKKGYKNKTLLDQLAGLFVEKKYENFVIVGSEYEEYMLNAEKHKIVDEANRSFIEQDTPIKLKDIFSKFDEDGMSLSKTFIYRFLKKWKIITCDPSTGAIQSQESLFDSIQGYVEVEKGKPCYLLAGTWYVFDEAFLDILNSNFRELFDASIEKSKKIKERFNFGKYDNEKSFNESLELHDDIIVTDTVLMDYIELSDAIFWDKECIYLMCNKSKFGANGSRDLYGQIGTAAKYLQKQIENSSMSFIEKYYDKISNKRKISISKNEFVDLFRNKKKCFVACFIKNYRAESQSQYAKYLTLDTYRELASKNYDFIPMGLD